MEQRKKYDEERELPSPWEWVIVTLFSASIIAFGLLVYYIIPEGPRHWDSASLPTPRQNRSTPPNSRNLRKVPSKRQLPRLPEAQPENPAKPPREQLKERSPKR